MPPPEVAVHEQNRQPTEISHPRNAHMCQARNGNSARVAQWMRGSARISNPPQSARVEVNASRVLRAVAGQRQAPAAPKRTDQSAST
jgi:hypothetical protein